MWSNYVNYVDGGDDACECVGLALFFNYVDVLPIWCSFYIWYVYAYIITYKNEISYPSYRSYWYSVSGDFW